jgi:transcriptional regulator with XRE-family HTH domain
MEARDVKREDAANDRRLRWNLQKLYDSLDAQRRQRGLSWPQLAHELRCTPSQVSGLKRARFAISMKLAMRIVHWLDCPARDFIIPDELRRTYFAGISYFTIWSCP